VINVERQYETAALLVGEDLGRDLVHHCLLLFVEKTGIRNEDAYFRRIMQNESRNGRFTKKYQIRGQAIHSEPAILIAENKQGPNVSSKVGEIIDQLESEGYGEEIALFKLKASGQTVTDISKAVGLCRTTVGEAIAFAKQQIKERYENYSD